MSDLLAVWCGGVTLLPLRRRWLGCAEARIEDDRLVQENMKMIIV